MASTFSSAARNAAIVAVGNRLNGGTLRLLKADGQTVAELEFAAPAFGAPVDGVITASAMAQATAVAGTVTKYEARANGGVEISGDVIAGTAAPANSLALVRTDFVGGEKVSVESFTLAIAGA